MKKSIMQGAFVTAIGLSAAVDAVADPGPRYCSESLVHGTYGSQLQGTRKSSRAALHGTSRRWI